MKTTPSTLPTPPEHYLQDAWGNEVHEDSKVLLDHHAYRGARFIDALTFVKQNPTKRLQQTFILGTLTFTGELDEPDPDPKFTLRELYQINSWWAGDLRGSPAAPEPPDPSAPDGGA